MDEIWVKKFYFKNHWIFASLKEETNRATNITTYEIVMYAAKWRMKMSIKVQRNEM